MKGLYVLDLAAPCDGLPHYTNGQAGGYVEPYAFRGAFLRDCVEIIGDELLESAWDSKLPEDTLNYGDRLFDAGARFASARGLDVSMAHSADDPASIEFRLDAVLAAGKFICLPQSPATAIIIMIKKLRVTVDGKSYDVTATGRVIAIIAQAGQQVKENDHLLTLMDADSECHCVP
jgi:hypothetical protein